MTFCRLAVVFSDRFARLAPHVEDGTLREGCDRRGEKIPQTDDPNAAGMGRGGPGDGCVRRAEDGGEGSRCPPGPGSIMKGSARRPEASAASVTGSLKAWCLRRASAPRRRASIEFRDALVRLQAVRAARVVAGAGGGADGEAADDEEDLDAESSPVRWCSATASAIVIRMPSGPKRRVPGPLESARLVPGETSSCLEGRARGPYGYFSGFPQGKKKRPRPFGPGDSIVRPAAGRASGGGRARA